MSFEISTGKGASLSGPPTPTPLETELSGNTRVNQNLLGIVSPEKYDELAVSDMGRQMTWKYDSAATKPKIPQLRLPVIQKPWSDDDKTWMAHFADLLNFLPPDVRERYEAESRLPFLDRNPAYGDLDALLGLVSSIMVWMKQTRQTQPSEFVKTQQFLNDVLVDSMLQVVLTDGRELLEGVRQMLDNIGHNDPNYDQVSLQTKQLLKALDILSTSKNNDLLVGDLASWSQQLEDRNYGDNFKILGTLAGLMSLISASTTIGTGAPALLLALGISTLKIDDNNIGLLAEMPVKQNLIDQLKTLLPLADNANQQMMGSLISAFLLTIITSTALTQTQVSPLLFGTTLQFAWSAGLFDVLGTVLAKVFGANEKTEPIASQMIIFSFLTTLFQTVGEKDKKQAIDLIESLKMPLQTVLNNIIAYYQNVDEQALNVKLQSLKLALENDQYDQFLQLQLSEEWAKMDEEASKRMEEEMKQFSALIKRALIELGEDSQTKANIGVFQG